MRRVRWTVGVGAAAALTLMALPALATNEDGEAAMGAAEAAASAAEAAPAAASEAAEPAASEASGAAAEAAPAEAPAGAETARGSVARATFTTRVEGREPQDEITSLPTSVSEVAFFTEFDGLTGHTLTHVWEYDGNEVARVPFRVQGPRWRVHSTKQLQPGWVGTWKVSVVDEDGTVLGTESFDYVAAESTAPPASTAAEPVAEEAAPPAAPED